MQKFPQIVRDRLRAKTAAGDHPDANILTAFTEQSLPETERSVVLEHLARCGDCRDVLALALPQNEPAPVAVPVRSGWLTWPALRWGLAAAGVVAIVSIGVVQFEQRRPSTVAKNSGPPESAITQSLQTPVSAPEAQSQPENKARPRASAVSPNSASHGTRRMMTTDNLQPRSVPTPATRIQPTPARPIGGPLVAGPNMPQQWQQQKASVQAFTPPTASEVNQPAMRVEASNAGAVQDVPPTQVTVEAQSTGEQLATQSRDLSNQIQADVQTLSRAKPATSAQAVPAVPIPLSAPQLQARSVVSSPRWTITPTGGLQRSFDQGNTWQDVEINAAPATSANLIAMQPAGAPLAKTNAAEMSPAAKKATKVAGAAAPVFRAVAANGNEIWAGGSAGALYHSSDTGDHWTRVLPASGGVTLTGDIIAIAFGDPLQGKVSTSMAETWSTSDGGQTWLKQ